jgi:hypothetical protein
MWLLVAIAAGLGFGAADQWLGTYVSLPWSWQVAQVSAPWLLLPFFVGAFTKTPRRAAIAGAAVALSAVSAYCAMILSPMEGVHLTQPLTQISATVSSQWPWFLGAAVIAPLYGIAGHFWRARRQPAILLVVVATVALEPLARLLTDRTLPNHNIWITELACGAALAAWVAFSSRRQHRPQPVSSGARGPDRGD